jgi:2-polyprenyl-6-methoxyphenol hydroxylase-like FAD-dependent oxidoreductase
MKVLISGAGIAGPCLAFWLCRHGFDVTIVERAPRLRTGGYIVDFWGAGFDVAERMGLLPKILQQGYKMREVRQVDSNGKRVSGFAVNVLDRLTRGRFTSVPRSALTTCICEALGARVETLFDDTIAAIKDVGSEVQVRFERTPPRSFDLVVGADGLHSQVRKLVFGDEGRFESFLGLKVAAFQIHGYEPRDEFTYVIHRSVGQQVGRFSMRDDFTLFLFVFADDNPEIPPDAEGQKALLRQQFGRSGWECPSILRALDGADGLYLDRVSQVHMDRWTRGRVALVGDAAFCPSFLAGQGSALAMVAAYILAGELKRANGNHEVAFASYQHRLYKFIAAKQKAAVGFATFFAPRSRLGIWVGNQVMKLMVLPFVTKLAAGRLAKDAVELPDY